MRTTRHTYTLLDGRRSGDGLGRRFQVRRDDGLEFWMHASRVQALKQQGLFDGKQVPLSEAARRIEFCIQGGHKHSNVAAWSKWRRTEYV